MGHDPTYDQDSSRGRFDNGSETSATWIKPIDDNFYIAAGTTFRIRFLIQETAGNGSNNQTFGIEYNHEGGGWNPIGPQGISNVVISRDSSYLTDQDTTQQIGSGTYVTPNNCWTDGASAGGGACDISGSEEVEVEWNLRVVPSDVSAGDTIQLRMIDTITGNDFATDGGSYTQTPQFEVVILDTKSYVLVDD
jgi:hypothetical protein